MGKNFWSIFRRWGRRKSSDDYVHIELSEPQNTNISADAGNTDRRTFEMPVGVEASLSETISHVLHHYVKPMLQELSADDGAETQSPAKALVVVAAALLWLLTAGSSLIHLVAALMVPAWRTARALEFGNQAERKRWLQYWGVYGVVGAVCTISYPILSLVPGFSTAKTLFLMWCSAPYPWHGSGYVATQLIVPLVRHLDLALTPPGGALTPPGDALTPPGGALTTELDSQSELCRDRSRLMDVD